MNMLNDHTVHFFWLSQLQSGWNGWILQFFKTLRWRHHPVMFTTNFEEYNHDRFRSSRVTVSLLDHFSIHPGASAIGSLSLVPKWIPWEIGWSWILSSDTIVIDWGPKPWWYVIICLQQSNRSRYFCCFLIYGDFLTAIFQHNFKIETNNLSTSGETVNHPRYRRNNRSHKRASLHGWWVVWMWRKIPWSSFPWRCKAVGEPSGANCPRVGRLKTWSWSVWGW